MLNTININLKTDIKTDRPTLLPITLMSQDVNNNKFILRFTSGGEQVALDDTYTVEVLTKFRRSGTSRLTTANVTPPPFKDHQDYAVWEFDTAYITRDEEVRNYVYVRKSGNLVVSADANCFVFNVGLSEVDKSAGRVAETYDENYQKYLDEFKAMVTGEGGGSYDDADVKAHMGNTNNPHRVTKAQVGLGNVSNVAQASKTEFDSHNADTTKHITTSERYNWNNKQGNLGFTPENVSNKGKATGYAGLDATGRVPVSQLPDFEEGLLNEATGTRLKYWAGSQAEYDAIGTYDLETVYDVW